MSFTTGAPKGGAGEINNKLPRIAQLRAGSSGFLARNSKRIRVLPMKCNGRVILKGAVVKCATC